MATLLKVLNNLADIKSAGVLRFASELRTARLDAIVCATPPGRSRPAGTPRRALSFERGRRIELRRVANSSA